MISLHEEFEGNVHFTFEVNVDGVNEIKKWLEDIARQFSF